MGSTGVEGVDPLRTPARLIDFLAEVTDSATRNPLRDILSRSKAAPDPLVWLDDVPEDIPFRPEAGDGVLLTVAPVPQPPGPPELPEELLGWVDEQFISDPERAEPELFERGPLLSDTPEETELGEPGAAVRREHERWLRQWRAWAERARRTERHRRFYEQLERAAKYMEQRDDEYEFVFAAGLVTWRAANAEIRRHLLTERVTPRLDRNTAKVSVFGGGENRRLEDRALFQGMNVYVADRAKATRTSVVDSGAPLTAESTLQALDEWLGLALDTQVRSDRSWEAPQGDLPSSPVVTASPALLLRPRSQDLIAEAYRRIGEMLRDTNATVPIGLAQLVVDVDSAQRDRWLAEQGASRGDVLGSDPLFPLSANDEQKRVLDLLRTETGVVVQGPPGTGKTHTIANLVSALLARGQRVLVTSQKEQALRVLRDKIPDELQKLCVLLAGGSKDAASELQRGLDALSETVASSDSAALTEQVHRLEFQRHELRKQTARLNKEIGELRAIETRDFGPVVPGYRTDVYTGTLAEIVRNVQSHVEQYGWMPSVPDTAEDVPPLGREECAELHGLLRQDSPAMRARKHQEIPPVNELPTAPELTEHVTAERQARQTADEVDSARARELAKLDEPVLERLDSLVHEAHSALFDCGLPDGDLSAAEEWVARVVRDRFAGRSSGLWGYLVEARDEPERLQQQLQALRFRVEMEPVTPENLGVAMGWSEHGKRLLKYLHAGGRIRGRWPRPKPVQKQAEPFLRAVRVNGRSPATTEELDAALRWLDAEVAAVDLVQKWAEVGVEVSTRGIRATLAELVDNAKRLKQVDHLAEVHRQLSETLSESVALVDLSTPEAFAQVLDAVPAARQRLEVRRAQQQVGRLHDRLRDWTGRAQVCPELSELLEAVADRDAQRYTEGLTLIETARREQQDELRREQLCEVLRKVHPELIDLLENTVEDEGWQQRLHVLPEAWAWSKADRFVRRQRSADRERELVAEFDQAERQLGIVTKKLAGLSATRSCLERMTTEHANALRTYRQHMDKVGAGTGVKAKEYRKAAKSAMHKAKHAVPAWVVPLPTLLETISAERDSFDVVIVDEASQVGLHQLFLLWMAPRVIVVGDDKQCTPGAAGMGTLETLFERLGEYLPELDHDKRLNFTSKSSLYDLLSARSGKDAVVRLREHFRCMPEIINYSSHQFYGDAGTPGLIPLREHSADRLKPLKVTYVEDGYTEGRDTRRRNPAEAERIVETLKVCLDDPTYAGKTFGVVVLQSAGQLAELEKRITTEIGPEQRQERAIRVGSPANFQGDERHVIFLSMLVSETPHAMSATGYQQAYNVAASRAQDQMWLFTSVRAGQLKPNDLRASLLNYMLDPPSIHGKSPALDEVDAANPHPDFDSLLEQRVFRAIKKHGYHVVPQYPVGNRKLDLVISGAGGKLAVECDGWYWHSGIEREQADARRDSELGRMGWETLRIRESEFTLDPDRELARVWRQLEQRGIEPDGRQDGQAEWEPVTLPENDDTPLEDL